MKIGRNDSCPCGSGKKYKKCCIGKSESEIKEATFRKLYKDARPKRQLITNGYFSKDPARIAAVAKAISRAGVNDLLLSVDAFHQETIPLDVVKSFAACLVDLGVPVRLSPAWLVSASDDNPYNVKTREILDSFSSLGIPVGSGNVIFPSGNALKYLGEYLDPSMVSPYTDDPLDVQAYLSDLQER